MNRMFCYLWYEKDKPDSCKFGEKWVKAGEDPVKKIWERIRSSVGVRSDLIKDGTIQLVAYWDVTEYAIKVGRYYQRSRTDDHIRPHIGFRKGSTGEIHEIPWEKAKIKVDHLLAKMGQPLPIVGLAAWQANTIIQVQDSIQRGNKTIVAELCARFGKTIWSGALIRETNAKLTIIVSYVLTSFTSFEKDLSGYEQFKDFVVIDSADPEFQAVVDAALAQDKQVVVFLSMCPGTKRKLKIEYLFELDCDRTIIIDEADFGVHKAGQATPLIEARQPNDTVVLMTGTNGDKAASFWPVDHIMSVVYPELIMEKKDPQFDFYAKLKLKHFEVDPRRHDLVVDVEFYQMDLKRAVDFAREIDPELFADNGIYLPSWTKTTADPVRAKGFLVRMLQAVFEAKHGLDELNVDWQTKRKISKEGQRVAMMFVPGSTTNENLEEVVAIAKQALTGFYIVAVYGGDDMTNRTAETDVKEEIERAAQKGQDVLLISAGMAQRSFSVGEITELYLAYDTGDHGATIQKISRALTPNKAGKVGRIISLSFDPNRDDKFDTLLIETAINYKKSHNLTSAKEALRKVLATVDIFRCSTDGRVEVTADAYLEKAIERNSVSRVVGKVADLSILSAKELKAVAEGNIDVYHSAKVESAQKGKTRSGINHSSSKGTASDELLTAKLIADARKVITTIVENMDIIIYGTGTHILTDAFNEIAKNPEKKQAVSEEFGLKFELIRDLFDRGVINTDLIELQVDH